LPFTLTKKLSSSSSASSAGLSTSWLVIVIRRSDLGSASSATESRIVSSPLSSIYRLVWGVPQGGVLRCRKHDRYLVFEDELILSKLRRREAVVQLDASGNGVGEVVAFDLKKRVDAMELVD